MITVLDRLLAQAENSECQEHLIEQAHYAVDKVHQKFLTRYESLVEEISGSLGVPEYNASTDGEERKNPMPKWVTGTRLGEASSKVLRLCYWKREGGISYLLLRMELDSKDRPTYYDLVLGARRKQKADMPKMDKLRTADTSFVGWVKRVLGVKNEDTAAKP
jgi:hypothetical protein